MDELKELLRVSLSGRISGVETFNQFTEDKKSLVYKLYSNIVKKKINTDTEARETLYGKNYSGKSYDMLKKRFKEKLYTNILFVQPREKNALSYAHNTYFVHKHYIVGKVLLMVAARKAGRSVLEKVLKRAQTFEITEIAMLAALHLKKESAIVGNRTLHQKYASLFKYFLGVLEAETEAENKYEDLFMYFSKSYKPRPELIPQAKEAFAYINKLKNTYGTFILHQASFQANTLYTSLCHNYKDTLKTCNEFEKYLLNQKHFYSPVRHGNIIITKLNCLLYLGRYNEGLLLAQQGHEKYESKEGNWLVLQELHFLLAIRAGNYALAAEIFLSVSGIQKNKNIDDRQKEMWRIYHGYLLFCLAFEKELPQYKLLTDGKIFSVGKLINETPIYSKDKQAINLSLQILQFCLLLQARNFEKAINKAEALKMYIYKYINRKEGAREHNFLKLILFIQKYNFNAVLLEKKSQTILEKLSTPAYNTSRTEVVLYEKLWMLILRILREVTVTSDQ